MRPFIREEERKKEQKNILSPAFKSREAHICCVSASASASTVRVEKDEYQVTRRTREAKDLISSEK